MLNERKITLGLIIEKGDEKMFENELNRVLNDIRKILIEYKDESESMISDNDSLIVNINFTMNLNEIPNENKFDNKKSKNNNENAQKHE